jgi:Sigma-70, region 4
MAIVRNIPADHLRRPSHRSAVSLDEHPALASLVSSGDPAAQHLRVDTVRDWLEQPKPREREVLGLRFGADLPVADIARTFELSEANMHQSSWRALRRLHRSALERRAHRQRLISRGTCSTRKRTWILPSLSRTKCGRRSRRSTRVIRQSSPACARPALEVNGRRPATARRTATAARPAASPDPATSTRTRRLSGFLDERPASERSSSQTNSAGGAGRAARSRRSRSSRS